MGINHPGVSRRRRLGQRRRTLPEPLRRLSLGNRRPTTFRTTRQAAAKTATPKCSHAPRLKAETIRTGGSLYAAVLDCERMATWSRAKQRTIPVLAFLHQDVHDQPMNRSAEAPEQTDDDGTLFVEMIDIVDPVSTTQPSTTSCSSTDECAVNLPAADNSATRLLAWRTARGLRRGPGGILATCAVPDLSRAGYDGIGPFLYQYQMVLEGLRDAARYLARLDAGDATNQANAANLAVTGTIDGTGDPRVEAGRRATSRSSHRRRQRRRGRQSALSRRGHHPGHRGHDDLRLQRCRLSVRARARPRSSTLPTSSA